MKLLIYTVCSLFAVAFSQAADTPEQVSEKYVAALRKDGLSATVEFLHPDELKKVAQLIVEMMPNDAEDSGKVPFLDKGQTALAFKKLSAQQQVEKFFGWLGKEIPQLANIMKTAQVRVLGHVTDGDTVYLVSKITLEVEGEKVEVTDVLPMKKSGDDYRVLLKGDFSQLLKAVKQKVKGKAK